jgi:hypothetical protein
MGRALIGSLAGAGVDPSLPVEVFSVADYVVEPADIFEVRLPSRMRELAPKVVQSPDGTPCWLVEGDLSPVAGAGPDTRSQHRLSRCGVRQLNSAIYTIAMIQIRMPASTGRAYYDKKIAEGKPPRYATRALKRHLAAHLWRIMLADETHTTRTPSEGATTAS